MSRPGLPNLDGPGRPGIRWGWRIDPTQPDELEASAEMPDDPEAMRATLRVLLDPDQDFVEVRLGQLPFIARRSRPEVDAVGRVVDLRRLASWIHTAGKHLSKPRGFCMHVSETS